MEAVPLNTSLYKEALIVLGAAGIVIPLFHRLHVSSVLGFMLVGVAVGPFGLASFAPYLPWLSAITISEPESIEPIAHLGVVLLLFMIGLELSFERLKVMRRLVFGLGSLQVVLCAALLAGVAVLLGDSRISAAVIGLALAMSSTAVVVQVLSEEKRLNTATGRSSFAILLFQDLAVVPVLLVLAALGPTKHAGSAAGFSLAVAQALLAIAAIVALGRLVLRPLFRSVARTRSPELFAAACLLVVIATGLATALLAGLPEIVFGSSGASLPESFAVFPTRVIHGVLAELLATLIFIHASAALYHHFIRRDRLLARMWFGRRWQSRQRPSGERNRVQSQPG